MSTPRKTSPRVLFLPNESDLSDRLRQIGPRAAFTEMQEAGLIRELKIYSFLHEYRTSGNREQSQQRLLEEIEAFQPDILFWQHPDDFPVDQELLREIRRRGKGLQLVYYEGDPFDTFYKRLKAPQRLLYVESDVFFTVSLGAGRRLFQDLREHKAFYYSPSAVDRERFGSAPGEAFYEERTYDAVMIGSIAYRLKGLLKHPGSAERIALGRGLTRQFGERFAVFGSRWPSGVNHRGFLSFTEQGATIRSSRMSVIWENFPHNTFYFSDRLPISLSAGVPHITSARPGYDMMFRDVPGLFFAKSVEDALDIAMYLRSLPLAEIVRLGLGARDWVLANLEARVVFRRAFEICLREWQNSANVNAG